MNYFYNPSPSNSSSSPPVPDSLATTADYRLGFDFSSADTFYSSLASQGQEQPADLNFTHLGCFASINGDGNGSSTLSPVQKKKGRGPGKKTLLRSVTNNTNVANSSISLQEMGPALSSFDGDMMNPNNMHLDAMYLLPPHLTAHLVSSSLSSSLPSLPSPTLSSSRTTARTMGGRGVISLEPVEPIDLSLPFTQLSGIDAIAAIACRHMQPSPLLSPLSPKSRLARQKQATSSSFSTPSLLPLRSQFEPFSREKLEQNEDSILSTFSAKYCFSDSDNSQMLHNKQYRIKFKSAADVGEEVACKLDSKTWILATVLNFDSVSKLYQLIDKENEEDIFGFNGRGQGYKKQGARATAISKLICRKSIDEIDSSLIIVAPYYDIVRLPSTEIKLPPHFWQTGDEVIAVFPDTTSFYPAAVAKDSSGISNCVTVKFDEDEHDWNGQSMSRKINNRYVLAQSSIEYGIYDYFLGTAME